MPRLAPSLFRRAGHISPHLATLLPACRTIAAAQAELRWIRTHVVGPSQPRAAPSTSGASAGLDKISTSTTGMMSAETEARISRLVARRGRGEPLQYVLGSQPFADLDIRCAKGVLIPRPETEAWASMLADLVFSSSGLGGRGESGGVEGSREESKEEIRILDLCSGTGCIGLSLYAHGMALRGRNDVKGVDGRIVSRDNAAGVRVFGFDVEARAVRLARRNLLRNFCGPRPSFPHAQQNNTVEAAEKAVTFRQADIFTDGWMASLEGADARLEPLRRKHQEWDKESRPRKIDILVSNPPYISQRGFATDTGRSVRNYEPKLALVPPPVPLSPASTACAPEDIFYARLLDIADNIRPRIAAFEVGDMKQAIRVAKMAISRSQPIGPVEGQTVSGDRSKRWGVVEIWRDWPDCRPEDEEDDVVLVDGREVHVRGSGHGRVVFLVEGQMMRNRYTNRGFRREVYTD
ncbi:S-adenosyl-L-methionine-dependent methyltransferase [Nemania sp. FL0031]|nr:S-adenosyl-L-methionine-dependent methyltransferase [Nemania sp. FL0031]